MDFEWFALFGVIAFIILVIVGCIALFFVNIGNMSDGTATDSIARISYGGWIWKTWKVQLTNDHPIEGNQMYYGIEHDQQLIEELQYYAKTGEKVRLYYRSDLVNFSWDYPDAEVIYKVEKVVK